MSESTARVACIWGANGISATAIIDLLVGQPKNEWKKIICISRRPPQIDRNDDRLKFLNVNLLEYSIEHIIDQLKHIGAQDMTDVFYYVYIEHQDEEELDKINRNLLQKVLEICLRVAAKSIRSFSLQTGYKYYGVHKPADHLAPLPFNEDASRHVGTNFYFTQEDLVKSYAEKYSWRYIITRPSTIIGVSKGNYMNFAVTIGIYAAIQKELKQPLLFPGTKRSWFRISDHSTASNNAEFQLWAVENPIVEHEIFNIANGDFIRMCDLWPKIESYFGFSHHEQNLSDDQIQIKLTDFIKQHQSIWEKIVEREGLDRNALHYATWSFADGSLRSANHRQGDLSKARRFGWTKTVDTFEGYAQCFDRLKIYRILPG